jgi:succinyl-diaminopimelate desuccinylase
VTNLSAADPVHLTRQLIAERSVTPEPGRTLDIIEAALTHAGFTVTRLNFSGDGSYPVENLFALRDRGGKRLLLAGHVDVVPPGDPADWSSDPFVPREADGLLYGRGAADMKSGVAALVAASLRAVAAGEAETGTIGFAITADEEADSVNGTEKIVAWMREAGQKFDFAIVGEPSSAALVGDSIKIGRRGSFSGRVRVEGVQGHVAYPERAKNPLPVLAAIATALSTTRLDEGTDHFPPSNLEITTIDVGNPTGNVIPAAGELRFNVRHADLWDAASLADWVRARIAEVDARGCTVLFEQTGRAGQAFLSPQGEAVAVLDQVLAERTGALPIHATGGGTSDARFIAGFCPVVEFGLVGPSMHKVDEHVRIDDIEVLCDLYRRFIARYLAK